MASSLISQFTKEGNTIYDPFSGAGTVALEAWLSGRHVIAGDLSPYAYALSRGKLYPPRDVKDAIRRLDAYWGKAAEQLEQIDLRRIPKWVRAFFDKETLREAVAIGRVLLCHQQWFLLSCLFGILHHRRPGFLSYPASHTVPYLQDKLYPRAQHPELYSYKEVYPRLLAKVRRAYARTTRIDRRLLRRVKRADALYPESIINGQTVSAIITSPPYMNSLSYGRDNRLRLWFLGVSDYRELEPSVSPSKTVFLAMIQAALPKWSQLLPRDGPCVLVLGAVRRDGKDHDLPDQVASLVRNTSCNFRVASICKNVIPDTRRARVQCRSTREDTVLLLRKGN